MEISLRNTEDNKIKETLIKVIILIGLNIENVSKEELQVVVNYIKKNYGYLDSDKLFKAFELCINGHLDFKIEKSKLSALLVSNVLQSFRRWEIRNNKHIKPITDVNRQIDTKPQTKEENALEHFKILKKAIENNIEPFLIDFDAVFWYMEKEKLIDLTVEDKKIFFDLTKEDLIEVTKAVEYKIYKDPETKKEHKFFIPGIRKAKENAEKFLKNEKLLKKECKKRLIYKYFENLKK
jgi:hypothetical protein